MARSGRKRQTREKEKEARVASLVASKPRNGALERPSVALVQRARARRTRAPKPYLRVPNLPDPPPPSSSNDNDAPLPESEPVEEQPLPKAETIYRNHLYNQSLVSGW